MPAARLRQFRHAWLDLRALVDSLLVMPVSSIVYMVNLIALTSFMAYEASPCHCKIYSGVWYVRRKAAVFKCKILSMQLSVAIRSDNISFAVCMFAFTVLWLLTTLVHCDSTHRAVESVSKDPEGSINCEAR